MTHLETAIYLNSLELNCSEIQRLIDVGRAIRPDDQTWQLELDRKQTEIDEKLEKIQTARTFITMQN